MENQRTVRVEDKVPFNLLVPLSIQHIFAMLGTSILMPFIFGINPAVVLFMNGASTLLFIGVIKGKAPAYLGSSFAFSASTGVIISNFGYKRALGGLVAVGFCGCILIFTVYKFEIGWTKVVLLPAVMDPVVALTGLGLSDSAASSTGLLDKVLDPRRTVVSVLTLETAVSDSVLFRGFFSVIPILIAVIVGHVSALAYGIVDFAEVAAAFVLALLNFSTPKFSLEAIMTTLPVLLVITSEHIEHQVVTNKIVGRNLLKDPGLHRSLSGDNFSTMIPGLIGPVPTATYSENIGVMAIARVYSVCVITGVTVLSIMYSFIGKFFILINTIPGPVIGGISFLLYGMIGTSGLRTLTDSRVDCGNSRNLALTSVMFVTGLSGIVVKFGNVQLAGMVLVCVVGMILNLVSYALDYFKLTNDQ